MVLLIGTADRHMKWCAWQETQCAEYLVTNDKSTATHTILFISPCNNGFGLLTISTAFTWSCCQ